MLKTLLFALFVVALTACGTDDATLTTLQEEMEEAGDDVAAAIADAQDELAALGESIQESEASDDLQNAWQEVQADLTEFFTSLQTEGDVDTEQLEQIMDDFEGQLDEAGDQIGPEVRQAWDNLRAEIERLMQEMG